MCTAQSGGTFATDKQGHPARARLCLLSTRSFPLFAAFAQGMCPSEKFNRDYRGFTTHWWFKRGTKTLVGQERWFKTGGWENQF
jgi:hypothetical protein